MPESPIKSKIEQSLLDKLADGALGLWHKLQSVWFRWAEYNQHHPMFPAFLAVFIAVDAIIVVVPGDMVLVLAVLSNPAKWKRIWLAGTVGGTVGGVALAWMIQFFGSEWVLGIAEAAGAGENIEAMRVWFNRYGLVTIAIGSCFPGTSWPPVVLAGLAGSPLSEVFAWLVVGRAARYFLFCFGTREGWAIFKTIRDKARAEKERSLAMAAKSETPPDDEPPQSSIQ